MKSIIPPIRQLLVYNHAASFRTGDIYGYIGEKRFAWRGRTEDYIQVCYVIITSNTLRSCGAFSLFSFPFPPNSCSIDTLAFRSMPQLLLCYEPT